MNTKWLKTLPLIAGSVLLVVLARPQPWSLAAGGVLVVLGEAARVWAAGHLNRNREVTTSGPYAYVRDPLYLGRLFLLVGFCLMGWGYDWILLLAGLVVFFLNYMPRKHRKEMARLEERFGAQYRQYAEAVHSLVPRLTRYAGAQARDWSFHLFWNENREQYLLGGVVLLALALIFRPYLPLP